MVELKQGEWFLLLVLVLVQVLQVFGLMIAVGNKFVFARIADTLEKVSVAPVAECVCACEQSIKEKNTVNKENK